MSIAAAYGYHVDPKVGLVIGLKGKPIGSRTDRGYIQIDATHVKKTPFAHRLIWEAVNGPIPDDLEINHINGVKHDNRIANLELTTRSGNMQHAYDTGLRSNTGDNSPRAILNSTQVAEIIRRWMAGERKVDLAREFGVNRGTVWHIANGSTWLSVYAAVTGKTA